MHLLVSNDISLVTISQFDWLGVKLFQTTYWQVLHKVRSRHHSFCLPHRLEDHWPSIIIPVCSLNIRNDSDEEKPLNFFEVALVKFPMHQQAANCTHHPKINFLWVGIRKELLCDTLKCNTREILWETDKWKSELLIASGCEFIMLEEVYPKNQFLQPPRDTTIWPGSGLLVPRAHEQTKKRRIAGSYKALKDCREVKQILMPAWYYKVYPVFSEWAPENSWLSTTLLKRSSPTFNDTCGGVTFESLADFYPVSLDLNDHECRGASVRRILRWFFISYL